MISSWAERFSHLVRYAPDGWPIWPIDEILSRRPVTAHVAERLRRLNPEGVREGNIPRGWHRKRTAWLVCSQRQVRSVRDVPRETLAALPRYAFYCDGKRRYVAEMYLA